jgi:hypothetical protein
VLRHDEFAVLRAPHDPRGVWEAFRAAPLHVSAIRRLAAGKRDPHEPGLVCSACTAEFRWSRWQLLLEAYDAARDPDSVGERYCGQHLSWDDWQRIAAGRPTRDEEANLKKEAADELWSAVKAGEVPVGEAPPPAPPGEPALLTFPTVQYRSAARGWEACDRGQLWVSAARVIFRGQRTVTVPHSAIGRCDVRAIGGADVVCLDAWEQFTPLYFAGPTECFTVSVGPLRAQLPLDSHRVAEVIRARMEAGAC